MSTVIDCNIYSNRALQLCVRLAKYADGLIGELSEAGFEILHIQYSGPEDEIVVLHALWRSNVGDVLVDHGVR